MQTIYQPGCAQQISIQAFEFGVELDQAIGSANDASHTVQLDTLTKAPRGQAIQSHQRESAIKLDLVIADCVDDASIAQHNGLGGYA